MAQGGVVGCGAEGQPRAIGIGLVMATRVVVKVVEEVASWYLSLYQWAKGA